MKRKLKVVAKERGLRRVEPGGHSKPRQLVRGTGGTLWAQ